MLNDRFVERDGKYQRVRTYQNTTGEGRRWVLVDATGQTLGRLASQVAAILRGKHKPTFTPHVDCGDHVIVINAEKIVVTGNKMEQKLYRHYSGYPGGLKERSLREMLARDPARVVRMAIWGMLPHNRLGRRLRTRLRVYAGSEHPHQAQQPEPIQLRY